MSETDLKTQAIEHLEKAHQLLKQAGIAERLHDLVIQIETVGSTEFINDGYIIWEDCFRCSVCDEEVIVKLESVRSSLCRFVWSFCLPPRSFSLWQRIKHAVRWVFGYRDEIEFCLDGDEITKLKTLLRKIP